MSSGQGSDSGNSGAVASNGGGGMTERQRLARLLEERRLRIEPVSYGQAALWHLYQLAPERSSYNTAFTARVPPGLDAAALRRAADALVARHPMLRTTYRFAEDRPVAVIHHALPVDWQELDGSGDSAAALRERVAADYRAPFDLARGPALRVRLYRQADGWHVLAIAMHHIAIDFTSLRTLVSDLGKLYRIERGGSAALAPLVMDYPDFARAQLARLAGAEGEALLAFWRRELDGAPPRLELGSRARATPPQAPVAQTFQGATYSTVLEAELIRAVTARSAAEGCTLYHALCAALAVLLSRHSGERDVVFGLTTTSRDRLELDPVIGYFINTPPLRVQLSEALSFRELVGQVRDKVLGVLEHADYPLLLMSQKLAVRRDPGVTPIFQVSFNMLHEHAGGELSAWWGEHQTGARLDLGGLAMEQFPVPLQDGILDLSVWACQVGERIFLELKYNTELFEPQAIAAMAEHYRTLLAEAVAEPRRPALALPMLAAAEQHRIVEEWNATAAPYDREIRLDELFAAQVARTPEALAVTTGAARWSYAELAGHSARMAALLGRRRGELVAIFLDRRLEMIAAVLAVVQAGAAYVPVDPSLPRARVAALLARHRIACAVTDRAGLAVLAELAAADRDLPITEVLCVDAPVAGPDEPAPPWPVRTPRDGAAAAAAILPAGGRAGTSDDRAYVIFTSGSTGTPKGVVVRHRPVVNLIEWMNRTFAVTPADRVLCVSSLSFDLSVYDIFGVLAAGGSLRLATTPELREPERLLQILAEEPITIWNSAPAMLQQLVPMFSQVAGRDTALRVALLSGDWIPLSLPDALRATFAKVRPISLGGATEAVVWSNVYPIGALDPAWVSIPYGRPIQNARYYVLDASRAPCPVGVAGDLYIGGECLASGYLDDPELTASKFVLDPFGTSPGAVMYRTGDRARFFPDGNLEFLGRLDDQVKIRGYRIELGEIEAALRGHPAVADCALVTIGARDTRQIVAYVVPGEVALAPASGASSPRLVTVVAAGEQTKHVLGISIDGAAAPARATLWRPPSSWRDGLPVTLVPRSGSGAPPLPAELRCCTEGSATLWLPSPPPDDEALAAWTWTPELPEPTTSAAPRAAAAGEAGRDAGWEVLRAHLRERLPEYMVPAHFVAVPRLPVTSNGKLDRRALPAPELATGAADLVAPRTPVEQQLAAVWADVLGLPQVSVEASFFDLGGHSLLATALLAKVRAELGVALPLRTLFTAPTVAALAAELAGLAELAGRAGQAAAAAEVLPSVRSDPARRYEPFALTDVQQAYWVGRRDDFEGGGVSTQLYQEFDLEDIDLDRLTAALRALVARHEALRMVVRDDGLQQVLPEVPPYEIDRVDLRGLAAAAAHARLLELREERCYRVRDASRWPLFEVSVAQLDAERGGDRFRLFLAIDVLIADARSLGILGLEWIQLYAHPEVALPPLEISFRDYLTAEAELRGLPIYQRSLDYWRRRAPSLPAGPELPLAKPPHLLSKPRFVRRTTRLPAEVWSRVERHAARAGVTAAAALSAAFAEVLAAWSRTGHFTLNLTLLQRLPLHPQAQALVGDFTSLTLLEVDASSSVPFSERARAFHQQLWSDLDHRYISGVQVMRERSQARPGAGLSYLPVVFTCVLDALPDDEATTSFLARHAKAGFGIAQTPQVWLDYQAVEVGGSLTLNWDAIEELFPAGLLDDMFEAHLGLLHRLAEAAGWREPLESLVPAAQRARHFAVNQTAAPWTPGLIHAPFQRHARSHPDDVAVIAAARTLRYGELDARAAAVGQWLRQRGARPGQLVAVVMEKGWEQVVAVLGILASGAAYVPIDASLPEQRIHRLLALGRAELVLTQASHEARLGWPAGVERLVIDEGSPASEPPAPPSAAMQTPDDLAYVIFTSGSTGEPKGVMIQHAAADNTIADINQRYRVGPGDRVLGVSALGFDLSVWDIFGALGAGATLVMPDARGVRDPQHWAALLRQHAITIWNSVPALMELVIDQLDDEDGGLLEPLRLVLLSGDWIPVALPPRIRARAPGAEVMSLGGATEAAIWSVDYPIREVDPKWRSVPYGRPLANQRLLVLDAALRPRPDLVPGDLFIAGVGLAQGYWGDAETSAYRFFAHPRTGERLYRTGDLARRLPCGNLEFLGRVDHQVKIHGHRIELGEIESALLEQPAVGAAAVIVRHVAGRAAHLEAYVVRGEGAAARGAEPDLRAALRERLPSYMVPALVIWLEALPLSANGKVDRAALRPPEEPSLAEAAARPAAAPLATPQELMVADVWKQVLEVSVTSSSDDFFVAGGDSIRAIQVVQQLRRRLPNLVLTVGDFFSAPTVAGLAAQVAAQVGRGAAAAGIAASALATASFPELERLEAGVRARLLAEYEDVYPANRVQQLIVRAVAEAPAGSGVYHLQQLLECRLGEGDAGALERSLHAFRAALTAVTARVPALRSAILLEHGAVPLVAVRRAPRFPIEEEDLRALSIPQQEARFAALFAEDRARSFDTADAQEPLVRFRLLRRSERDLCLFFSIHHALWDGWSNTELYSQLHAAHGRMLAQGEEAARAAAPDVGREFAAWERRKLERDGAAARRYWRAQLATPPGERPASWPASSGLVPVVKGAATPLPVWQPPQMFSLPAEDFTALERLARDLRVTVKALLLRTFVAALAPAGEASSSTVGVVANRRSDELTDPWSAMGLFWNLVPFRFTSTGSPRGDALSVHAQLLEMEEHVWYPFGDGGEPGGDPGEEPAARYDALFNFIHLHNLRTGDERELRLAGLRAYDKYHLPLNSLFAITPANRGLSVRLEYDPRRYQAGEIHALGERLQLGLRELIGGGRASIVRAPDDLPAWIPMSPGAVRPGERSE